MIVDTIVIHSMYAPGAPNEFAPEACVAALDQYKVSAHYLVTLTGDIWQLVEETKRAWHAGVSRMPGPSDTRENVNHFSIGIELIGRSENGFSGEQYHALAALCRDIGDRYPITNIVGHDQIAPGRKDDPGGRFDWARLRSLLPEQPKIRVGV